ncbi:lipopolysaccharide assembly protein LapA domain-containing protein [Chelatococcus reniformis]|uniref:Lipopolysaccharide assembly protein A domain-containing protein n=1 Tax=Chelatococcus reniformis TaxID=1494448 RepID=A0A916U917_9HYPH|nr:lipopolysaccharide assembly protein LapA domain-containing protein [Chelatococcus reniformis]GGC64227.1 hypothetical protein GCM10010994_23590 [Chelatococcus reniformis]
MKTLLRLLVLLPLAIVIVLLAIANRTPVLVSLDPFTPDAPALGIQLPLFVVMFAALLLGVLVGGLASWLVQGRHRRAARLNRREAERLKGETERLKSALAARAPALGRP